MEIDMFYSLRWKCPKCGKTNIIKEAPEEEYSKFIIECPFSNGASITFVCDECGCEFKLWVEEAPRYLNY